MIYTVDKITDVDCMFAERYETRSNRRAQPSSAASLRSAKLAGQAWNSLAITFLRPNNDNCMNIHVSVIL